MKPYYYSDFLSSYVKNYFTEENNTCDEQFIDELYHYIYHNPSTCIDKYGEFLHSTIHSSIVLNHLLDYYSNVSYDSFKAYYLQEFIQTNKIKELKGNLLGEKMFVHRIMKNLYETHTLN
jgi:hypothetical protein